ncbi:MAG: NUDIX domain-containing protein [Candidatus Aenigmarchaeota archaeon]|nr:NUDIX domain-containing protein [Candidatus Aenigmarchaeota archaeon]
MRQEFFDVVDDDDNVIGRATRQECHRKQHIHRAVHVFIFNRKGEMLLQKRSRSKDLNPNKWTSSASGHLMPGERYTGAAHRELEEELGIKTSLRCVHKFRKRVRNDYENTKLFVGFHEGPFRPDRKEVQKVSFFRKEAIRKKMKEDRSIFTPGFLQAFGIFFRR